MNKKAISKVLPFWIFMLLAPPVMAQTGVIANNVDIMLKLRATLVEDSYWGCEVAALSNGSAKIIVDTLKFSGFYLRHFRFFRMQKDYSSFECHSNGVGLFNEYIVAVAPNNKIYRLKGYQKNDFTDFLLDIRNRDQLKIADREITEDSSVESLDLLCLMDAMKYIGRGGKAKYEVKDLFPCMWSCDDMMHTHMINKFNKKYIERDNPMK